jgi:hypothetical protein
MISWLIRKMLEGRKGCCSTSGPIVGDYGASGVTCWKDAAYVFDLLSGEHS